MCGIIGVSLHDYGLDAAPDLLEGALLLQHRGQDACGIVCGDTNGTFTSHKGPGLLTEVFTTGPEEIIRRLRGSFGIGHVRYATNGNHTNSQIQPIMAPDKGNVALCHNGNLTNADQLYTHLQSLGEEKFRTEKDSKADSELMLDMILSKRSLSHRRDSFEVESIPSWVSEGLKEVYRLCVGSFAAILFLPDYGIVAFRDANAIKPLVLGERRIDDGAQRGQTKVDYMFASETVAFDSLGYELVRDVMPGEAIFIPSDPTPLKGSNHNRYISRRIVPEISHSPDVFEYVYFARSESIIDGISVHKSRQLMGEALARALVFGDEAVRDGINHNEIDCVIPVPETSYICALSAATTLRVPFTFGLVRNRFLFRTFILPNQEQRVKAVSRKLHAVKEEFTGKNVLIVDDSIVRGTTSKQIVNMARAAGARKVFLASCSPAIRYKHIHGIDLADESKLVAHQKSTVEIRNDLGCDGLMYLPLESLIESCLRAKKGGKVKAFEVGVFTGAYVTDAQYCAIS